MSESKITIDLVRVGNVLIGRTASDRFNLETLGVEGPIESDRNQLAVKKLRRLHGDDFTFRVVRSAKPVWTMTHAEKLALTPTPIMHAPISLPLNLIA